MVGLLLFCCLLAIIGVVNVSMAFVGVGYWFVPDSVGLDWERYDEWEEGSRGEWGTGVEFFHFYFCIVNGHANAGRMFGIIGVLTVPLTW